MSLKNRSLSAMADEYSRLLVALSDIVADQAVKELKGNINRFAAAIRDVTHSFEELFAGSCSLLAAHAAEPLSREKKSALVRPMQWHALRDTIAALSNSHAHLESHLRAVEGKFSALEFQIMLQELSAAGRLLGDTRDLFGCLLLDFGLPTPQERVKG